RLDHGGGRADPSSARRLRSIAARSLSGQRARNRAPHPGRRGAEPSGDARELPDAPAGVPDSYSEHVKLLFDLQVLALETDMTRIIWGSPMADPNIHNHRRCPLVLLGHAGGGLKGNLHVKASDGTPMANVMLALLHQLGLDDMKTFGDSTGEFSFAAPATAT